MILEPEIKNVSNRSSTDLTNELLNQEINSAVKDFSKEKVENKEDKKILNKKSPEKNSLEEITKETIPENEIENLREQYGLMEDQNLLGVDYDSLFSYLEHNLNPEEVYDSQNEFQNENSVLFESGEEIEETVLKINIAYALGDKNSVSYEEKEKLRNLAEFNFALLSFYMTLSPIKSDNVDYSKLN